MSRREMLEMRKQVDELQARVDELRGVLAWGKYKGWREPAVGDRVRFTRLAGDALVEETVAEVFANGGIRAGDSAFTREALADMVLVFHGEPQPVIERPLTEFVPARPG